MNTYSPTHEEIAQRAREIWTAYGSPDGRDTEIWLEAEHQLIVGPAEPDSSAKTSPRDRYDSPAEAFANSERRAVESGPSSRSQQERGNGSSQGGTTVASPDDATAKSAQQKKSARSPKVSVKNAPKAAPTESGKPLWDKPHSS